METPNLLNTKEQVGASINSYFKRTKLIVTLYWFKLFVKYKGLMLNTTDSHLTAIFERIIAKQ